MAEFVLFFPRKFSLIDSLIFRYFCEHGKKVRCVGGPARGDHIINSLFLGDEGVMHFRSSCILVAQVGWSWWVVEAPPSFWAYPTRGREVNRQRYYLPVNLHLEVKGKYLVKFCLDVHANDGRQVKSGKYLKYSRRRIWSLYRNQEKSDAGRGFLKRRKGRTCHAQFYLWYVRFTRAQRLIILGRRVAEVAQPPL